MKGVDFGSSGPIPVSHRRRPKSGVQQFLKICVDGIVNVPVRFPRFHPHLERVIRGDEIPHNSSRNCKGPPKISRRDDFFVAELLQRQKSCRKVRRDFVWGRRHVFTEAAAETSAHIFGDLVDMAINQ
jgi:hypothetical protein